MLVMKFGGSSISTPNRIKHVISLVQKTQTSHRRLVVVFSAFQGITDQLIELSNTAAEGDKSYLIGLRSLKRRHFAALNELVPARLRNRGEVKVLTLLNELSDVLHGIYFTKEVTARMLDYVMSFGELLSTTIIAEAVKARNIRSEFLDSRVLIKTDDSFGMARVKYDLTYLNVRAHFKKHPAIQIACGFIASTTDNDTTTLGRGGSDFTASLYGAALGASEIEIWTDVDGVNTADPKKVEKAFPLEHMTYAEAMEMSHFGAKVIHPPTMQPALDMNIPIRIKNTFNQDFPGTLVTRRSPKGQFAVKGISSIDDIALLKIQGSGLVGTAGIGRRIFSALARKNINVFMVTQASSEYSLCLAISPREADSAKALVEEELHIELRDRQIEEVLIERELSVVAVVGENMRKTTGISGKLFQALGNNGINVVAIAQGSSELNISTIVAKADEAKALNALHEAFFLSGRISLNVFLVGVGVVGGRLLEQIAHQREILLQTRHIDVRVQAIANSRKMLFDTHEQLPLNWRRRLAAEGHPMDLELFVKTMYDMNLPNSIFVDCTASDAPVALYESILRSSISIVTPNKRANAGKQRRYERLHESALGHNVRFLYETNVGAGLPIINTMNDLVAGGDSILRIDGVLSGTLSYLFNSFTSGRTFSEIVAEAKEKGFTEPDPRDDLNGLDVGRKLLILAREAGHKLEFKNVRVESLVPRTLLNAPSVAGFMQKLKSVDGHYAQLRDQAAKKGQTLRYLASFADGNAQVSLRQVGPDHPAFSLSGSEIIIALTTTNCHDHPVVIRGPGAGADVTATGVFADIIRIAHHQG
ncbi:MAG: bifunctional aspartate kinase/homoserine dehydrogenase I [Bacteroidota bacterium]